MCACQLFKFEQKVKERAPVANLSALYVGFVFVFVYGVHVSVTPYKEIHALAMEIVESWKAGKDYVSTTERSSQENTSHFKQEMFRWPCLLL